MARFTVVIPYYQKQAGILQRALASVFAQSHQDFDILIVDDESPFPIETELGTLSLEQRARIRVISQANAGPGGARNTGLDNVATGTDFVAFLDSDDSWTPDHLDNAKIAMTQFGADCYWASITGGDAFYYHFDMVRLERTEKAVRLSDKPLILEVPSFPKVMLRDWGFLHLSCMVIGRRLFETVRFAAALRLAAEDVLFFCDCAIAAKRVVLCNEPGAVRGEGVNIFHGIDSDSPQFLSQQFNTWVALDTLESRFPQKTEEVVSIHSYKQTARKQALWSQARRIRRREMPQFSLLARWVIRDPLLIRNALQLAVGRLTR
ncbi:glycosyltransferase family 2 protein [Pararhizobium gei]|uniref:glycosyltransferase family 2 protein n=1 Tax=Pararhizobium gei TaxID=1395951 RepID=UPI0023DBF5E9|nr:glycosyltransferase family 2 protein [Rhizobium gei]